jgi:hypothetical protein
MLGSNPVLVRLWVLAVSCSNHSAKSHPFTRLVHLIHNTRLDRIHNPARPHPQARQISSTHRHSTPVIYPNASLIFYFSYTNIFKDLSNFSTVLKRIRVIEDIWSEPNLISEQSSMILLARVQFLFDKLSQIPKAL